MSTRFRRLLPLAFPVGWATAGWALQVFLPWDAASALVVGVMAIVAATILEARARARETAELRAWWEALVAELQRREVVGHPNEASSAREILRLPHHGKPRSIPRIERPPGYRTSAALRLLFGKRAVERVFGQIVSDAHEEWIEAAKTGNEVERRRVLLYTPIHLLIAMVTYPLVKIAKQVDAARKVFKSAKD